jgi:two-component system sensor histidine kinase AgrC
MFVILKNDFRKSILYYSLIMIFGILSELLLSIILSIFFTSITNLAFWLQPLLILFTYLVWFGGWAILISSKRVKYILKKIEDSLTSVFKIEVLLIVLFFIIDVVVVKNYFDLKNHLLLLASIVTLNLLFILIFIILKNRLKLKTLEISSGYLKNNIDLYEKIIRDHNVMKHNLINDLMIIKSVANNKSQKIIDETIKSYKEGYSWISDINNLPEGLKGLICLKIVEAKSHGVELISECSGFYNYNISKNLSAKVYLDLCEKLDIVIDNAIEAALLCRTKIVKVVVSTIKNKIVAIEVSTPFLNEIDFSKFGQENNSTKMRNSGYGLYYLLRNKKSKIKTKFEIVNDIYITKITIDTKNIASK